MIYVYGDSHTAGMQEANPIRKKYKHIAWPKFLGEMMDMPVKNMAKPGKNIILNVNDLISQIFEIKDNAKIVIFQFQFFFNTLLRIDDSDIGWKELIGDDKIVFGPEMNFDSRGKLKATGLQQQQLLEKLEIVNVEDINSILTWCSKFEERRMWYEMNKIKLIYDELEKFGIKCYCFYWLPTKIFLRMDTENRIIKFGNKKFVNELQLPQITDETNGEWDDGHLGTNSNKILAEHIYNYIKNDIKTN